MKTYTPEEFEALRISDPLAYNVVIAKDVIAAIEANQYLVRSARYCTPVSNYADDYVWVSRTRCMVCAAGAAVLAWANRVKPDLTVGQARRAAGDGYLQENSYTERVEWAPSDDCTWKLAEHYFEGWDVGRRWVVDYPNARERLIALMRRIISNGGKLLANEHPQTSEA
jgi:hypothetical protein